MEGYIYQSRSSLVWKHIGDFDPGVLCEATLGLRATTYNLLVGMTQARSAAGAQKVGQLARPGADARLSP